MFGDADKLPNNSQMTSYALDGYRPAPDQQSIAAFVHSGDSNPSATVRRRASRRIIDQYTVVQLKQELLQIGIMLSCPSDARYLSLFVVDYFADPHASIVDDLPSRCCRPPCRKARVTVARYENARFACQESR